MVQVPLRPTLALALVLATAGGAAAEPEVHHRHHAHHPYHLAVFVGATVADDTTGASFGLDLERRLGRFGVAAIVDITRMHGGFHEIVVPALVVHPAAGLKVLVGAGWEHASGHDAVVVRAGAGYDLHVGSLSLGPSVSLDRADGATAVVAGATLGTGF